MTYSDGLSFLKSHQKIQVPPITQDIICKSQRNHSSEQYSKRKREGIHLPICLTLVSPCSNSTLQGVNQIISHTSLHSFPSYITFWQWLSKSDPLLCVVSPEMSRSFGESQKFQPWCWWSSADITCGLAWHLKAFAEAKRE